MADKPSRMRTFFGRLRLFILPLLFVLLTFWAWLVFRMYVAPNFPIEDAGVLADTGNTIATFHAIIAGIALVGAETGRKRMYEALDSCDFITFVRLRDERIFWPIHWMLAVFSGLLLICAFITAFVSGVTGSFVIISTAAIVSLYWQAAEVADKPLSSAWYQNDDRIPEEIRTMTLEQARERTALEMRLKELRETSPIKIYGLNSREYQAVLRNEKRR